MSLTDVMEDVDYVTHDWTQGEGDLRRHPLWLTEAHFVYHLERDQDGNLYCIKDRHGEPICSPRPLRSMCIQKLVTRPSRLRKLKLHELPYDLYPCMLTEAIFQRELRTVVYLVSTWPHSVLDVQSLLPLEDVLQPNYLTAPSEDNDRMSLADSFIIGLLNLKPHAKLRLANFIGFKHERKLCRELARLPILWMRPGDRQAGYIHSIIRRTLMINKEKVQRYLNRIRCIYSNIDLFIRHGHQVGPITVLMDCKATVDDVPIGLALQWETPFRFACQRLWTEPITDLALPVSRINRVLEPRHITHLEIEEPAVCGDMEAWDNLLEGLLLLPSLQALSLPNTVHCSLHSNAAFELGECVQEMQQLRKLSLASCHLRDALQGLLRALWQPLIYLNLRDCRLSELDISGLLTWKGTGGLYELNLSRNNLKTLSSSLVTILGRMPRVTCFYVSYCCFSVVGLLPITRQCSHCQYLKVLAIQSFTPPAQAEVRELLQTCAAVPFLQRCLLFPEAYAFPGSNELERLQNRETAVEDGCELLDQFGRPDVELE